MKVKVINRSAYGLPQYETGQAAGLDEPEKNIGQQHKKYRGHPITHHPNPR